ncbi:MAG TPA: DUF3109 family protein [Ignavibacteriaceae bacterium]|nr:DUF3109 family protein [Ignavibacteriaceae bacterium]
MFVSNLIPVEEVLINSEIAETRFSCDLKRCKGACCTLESHYGAPLQPEEIDKIKEILPAAIDYLPEEHKAVIEEKGFYEVKQNDLFTRSFNNRACVFVYYENDIAKCSIEKAYLDGKINFKKPISCHLFPIRVSKFGGDVLRMEHFNECAPALENGIKKDMKLIDFCAESLKRLYGKKWYLKLKETIGE